MNKIYEKWEVDFIDQRIKKGKDVGQITYAEAIEFGARRQKIIDRKMMAHKPTDENLTKEELMHQLHGYEVMSEKAKRAFCDAICGRDNKQRPTCLSLGTCNEYDEFVKAMRI